AGGVRRLPEQRRTPDRRHHHRGAGPPLRRFYAELSKFDPARRRRHPPHSRNDRAILVRPNLRRLVEGERLIRRESRRRAIGGTLSARDRTGVAARPSLQDAIKLTE